MMHAPASTIRFDFSIDPDIRVLDAAIEYFRAGAVPVFLHGIIDGKCTCGKSHDQKTNGKHPILRNWQSSIPKDENAIHDQFQSIKVATPNVGLVLGAQQTGDYLIAIDKDSEERFDELTGEFGALPKTPRCDSGRGHRLFYRLPAGIPTDRLKNVTGIGGQPGVDAKVKGGQVVVAPSKHFLGGVYSWVADTMGALAELPMTWVDALIAEPMPPPFAREYTPETIRADERAKRKLERYLERAVIEECSRLSRMPEGLRNTYLHRKAISLLSLVNGCFLPARWGYVLSELDKAARAAGLSGSEVRKTLTSAENYVTREGATRGPRPVVEQPQPTSSPPSGGEPPSNGAAPAAQPAPEGEPPPQRYPLIVLVQDRGQNAAIAENVARMLIHHPDWNGGPRLDRYSDTITWPKNRPLMLGDGGIMWSKNDRVAVQAWCIEHGIRVGIDIAEEGARTAAKRRSYDSLIDWVNAIPPWDGKMRLDRWLHTYFGCRDDAYHQMTGRSWLRGCIERALTPGLLVDIVPILSGNQRANKNYALNILFGSERLEAPWLSIMGKFDPDRLDLKRLATTRWILHDDEFKGRDPKNLDKIKSWVSMIGEEYLAKYEMDLSVRPRRALLVCSTNEKQMLFDWTGNRRWVVWQVGTIDIDALMRDRMQLLAEAKQSAPWREGLDYDLMERAVGDAEVVDPLRERLLRLCTQPTRGLHGELMPPAWHGWVTSDQMAEMLGVPPERADQSFAVRLGRAIEAIHGYTRRTGRGAGCIRFYRPPEAIDPQSVRRDLAEHDP